VTIRHRDRWRKCSSRAEKRQKGTENRRSKRERFIDGDSQGINDVDHFSELGELREIIPEGTDTVIQALQYVKSLDGSFPSTEITYRVFRS
jgi:hypothetical protein